MTAGGYGLIYNSGFIAMPYINGGSDSYLEITLFALTLTWNINYFYFGPCTSESFLIFHCYRYGVHTMLQGLNTISYG